MSFDLVLLPGDGIGPEVLQAAVDVLDAVTAGENLDVRYTTLLVGGAAIDAYETPLRAEDLERCRQADALLLGAVGGPVWDELSVETRPERALLRLRSELNLGINLRPVAWTPAGGRYAPLTSEVAQGTDIAFVRELTGGVYFGQPSYYHRTVGGRHAVDTSTYSEKQVQAVLEFAFELARSRRGKVTSVDKANVMNTSRLWREVATEYGQDNPDVELEHALVDSFAMSLIGSPRSYDVVVTENLFGDILTDLAGVIAGSLGVLPSASLRPGGGDRRFGMYEPIHGSAPPLRGQNVANPVGSILSVALMLHWSLGRTDLGAEIQHAVSEVMAGERLTADLTGADATSVGTREFTAAVIEQLKQGGGARDRRDIRHHVA
jgi:3-isopropylmalate dehydrogenase